MNGNIFSPCSQLSIGSEIENRIKISEDMKNKRFDFDFIPYSDEVLIRIISHSPIKLVDVFHIFEDLDCELLDEFSSCIDGKYGKVYVGKYIIKIDDVKSFISHQHAVKQVIETILLNNMFKRRCKLISLSRKQGFKRKEIMLFRAFAVYIQQITSYSTNAVIKIFKTKDEISYLFLQIFRKKFMEKKDYSDDILTINEIIKSMHGDDAKIAESILEVLEAIKKTNFFSNSETITFKVFARELSFLKGIVPKIETFVYDKDFMGIHLRMDEISRGGLRWSYRKEDLRDEIRSLMIAQSAKNSVIVPYGAKGGFSLFEKDVKKENFKVFYQRFVHALLDVVDLDISGDDSYFVVAADRGTSDMSDVANEISEKRDFWLNSAFASGGKDGYDHKKLGITAKGAIYTSQRFFLERGRDLYNEEISVVAVGSMNGDVCGNGLLQSKYFKVLAAISSKEIFIDPNPDSLKSYEERKRLFDSQDGKWSNYSKEILSEGGAVFNRMNRKAKLTPQIAQMLDLDVDEIDTEELVKLLLKLNVDMLFFGAIGTYVKAEDESNLDVNDRSNDAIRVNANELKCKVVSEGANLALTHKARIEYSLQSGLINQDSIDNSAGVNISDYEVNIKILLQNLEEQEKSKNLKNVTDEVVKKVVNTNYKQALALSLEQKRFTNKVSDIQQVIHTLGEMEPSFKRTEYSIPAHNSVVNIFDNNNVPSRAVMSTLLSFSKLFIKNFLSKELDDSDFLDYYLFKYFPKYFHTKFKDEILNHKLRKEISIAMISSIIIDNQGIGFILDYDNNNREKFYKKIIVYLLMDRFISVDDIRESIYKLETSKNTTKTYETIIRIEDTLARNTEWILDNFTVDLLEQKDKVLAQSSKFFEYLNSSFLDNKLKINSDNRLNQYSSIIDYLQYSSKALFTYLENGYDFIDILGEIFLIVEKLKVIEINNILENIETYSETEELLKRQLFRRLDLIVVDLSENIQSCKNENMSCEVALESYFTSRNIDFQELVNAIELELENVDSTLLKLEILINKIDLNIRIKE